MEVIDKKQYRKPEISTLSTTGTMDPTKSVNQNEGQPTDMSMQKGMGAS
jgi:hypothetical protein